MTAIPLSLQPYLRRILAASTVLVGLSVFVGVALPSNAHAQVNIETIAAGADLGFGATVGGGFELRRGNVKYDQLSSQLGVYWMSLHDDAPDAKAGMTWFRRRVLLSGNLKRRSADGEVIANQGFYHVRYTEMFLPRLGAELFQQEEFNEFRKLSLRSLAGAGARAVLFNAPTFQAWLGTGYMAEWENWNLDADAGVPADQLNHRWTSYLGLRATLADGGVQLVSTTYAQPRLDDLEDLQLLQNADLVVKINEMVALTSTLALSWDTRPVPGVEEFDLTQTNGLKLKF